MTTVNKKTTAPSVPRIVSNRMPPSPEKRDKRADVKETIKEVKKVWGKE